MVGGAGAECGTLLGEGLREFVIGDVCPCVVMIQAERREAHPGPKRNARDLLEMAMLPNRSRDRVKADLEGAGKQYLEAAALEPDGIASRASAFLGASLVLGLLGDAAGSHHCAVKAWEDSVEALAQGETFWDIPWGEYPAFSTFRERLADEAGARLAERVEQTATSYQYERFEFKYFNQGTRDA
jgi:hypothetical protein